MYELQAIKQFLSRDFVEPVPSLVLATIVKTEGTTFRKAGAVVLLSSDGDRLGLLSGGCLESTIHQDAYGVMATGQSALFSYDLTDENEALLGYGSGCPGITWVLMEPVILPLDHREIDTLLGFDRHPEVRARGVVFKSDHPEIKIGEKLSWDDSGRSSFKWGSSTSLGDGHWSYEIDGKYVEVYLKPRIKVPRIHIFGSGLDAERLSHQVFLLGWHQCIYDRKDYSSRRHRFSPDALFHEGFSDFERIYDEGYLECTVMMTHNFYQDLEILGLLAPRPLSYLGILSSRSRIQKLRAESPAPLLTWMEELGFYGPIGLPLGGRSPSEIALAVVAQIQGHLFGRNALGVKDKIK